MQVFLSLLKLLKNTSQVSLEVVNTDFASSLLPRLRNAVDVLLFNPPYVPTEDNEAILAQTERGIQGSWAGGKDGMRITNQFLPLVHVSDAPHRPGNMLRPLQELLSPSGQFYLVTVKENNVPNIQKRMLEDYGLSGSVNHSIFSIRTTSPRLDRPEPTRWTRIPRHSTLSPMMSAQQRYFKQVM